MASEEALLQEINAALQREKTEKLFKEYGPYLLAGAVLAILLTGLISGYRSWNNKVNAAQTAQLMEALSATEQAAALEALIPALRPGHRAMAYMTAAGALMAKDNPAEAREMFKNAAADPSLPPLYSDLAKLMSVKLSVSGDGNEQKADELQAVLATLLGQGNPWRWHALVESALIAAHMKGNYAAARATLSEVLSTQSPLPPSLVERARALDQIFAQRMTSAKPKPPLPDSEG